MLTNLRVAITLVSVLPLVAATGSYDDCPSRQSGTLGHAAIINCSIGSNLSGVCWYRSNDMLLVCYEVENRSEHQSENEEYGIESDGSLRINNVSSPLTTVYRVVFYNDENRIHKKRIRFLVNTECSTSEDLERRKENLERKKRKKERKRQMRLLRKERKMKKKIKKKMMKNEQQKQRKEIVKQKREKTRAKKQER